jgi:hypothetical protein
MTNGASVARALDRIGREELLVNVGSLPVRVLNAACGGPCQRDDVEGALRDVLGPFVEVAHLDSAQEVFMSKDLAASARRAPLDLQTAAAVGDALPERCFVGNLLSYEVYGMGSFDIVSCVGVPVVRGDSGGMTAHALATLGVLRDGGLAFWTTPYTNDWRPVGDMLKQKLQQATGGDILLDTVVGAELGKQMRIIVVRRPTGYMPPAGMAEEARVARDAGEALAARFDAKFNAVAAGVEAAVANKLAMEARALVDEKKALAADALEEEEDARADAEEADAADAEVAAALAGEAADNVEAAQAAVAHAEAAAAAAAVLADEAQAKLDLAIENAVNAGCADAAAGTPGLPKRVSIYVSTVPPAARRKIISEFKRKNAPRGFNMARYALLVGRDSYVGSTTQRLASLRWDQHIAASHDVERPRPHSSEVFGWQLYYSLQLCEIGLYDSFAVRACSCDCCICCWLKGVSHGIGSSPAIMLTNHVTNSNKTGAAGDRAVRRLAAICYGFASICRRASDHVCAVPPHPQQQRGRWRLYLARRSSTGTAAGPAFPAATAA